MIKFDYPVIGKLGNDAYKLVGEFEFKQNILSSHDRMTFVPDIL